MTTRHGDRFKIAGGKHIKTYIPVLRKMQFSLPLGQHCEASAFAFRFHY